MQKILSTDINAGATLDNLAISKGSAPIRFYIDAGKNTAAELPSNETVITVETSHGVVATDYIRINNEVMYVIQVVAAALTVRRAQRGTTAVLHATAQDIYIEQDNLNETQLGAGTAVITESRTVIDIQNPEWYDIALEAKVIATGDESGSATTLHYAFCGYADIPLTSALDAAVVNIDDTLTVTFPNAATLYYSTGTLKPTARYLYLWVTGHAGLDTAGTYMYLTINQV